MGYTAPPNVAIAKTVDHGVAGFNESVAYTMTITNTGGTALDFALQDVLPITTATAPFTVSASDFLYLGTDSITVNGDPFVIPNLPEEFESDPTWFGFDLPAASTLIIVFSAFTGANEGEHFNGASIELSNPDPGQQVEFPDLTTVTLSDIGDITKAVTEVNDIAISGTGISA